MSLFTFVYSDLNADLHTHVGLFSVLDILQNGNI